MSEIPANEIRAAREARGWDQAELARRIGVGQQTVSRWETGRTAPKGEKLAQLRATLGLDGAATPPRRPLLEELPFNRLDAYQFEAFCEVLASRLYPGAREVLHYGVGGDDQHGIDIRVVTADGERIGIQCKKYEKFHPSSFAKAVKELDHNRAHVDRCVLFLSTRATAAVLGACDDQEHWTIWDSRTLSREVSNLPRDQALSLLDRFFPDMREEFLGVPVPSVWLSADEAFPVTLPSAVYSHGFRLVGRAEVFDAMTAFAADDAEPRIAVLTGVAGRGKSRLLRELAHTHRGTTRVLTPGPVAPDAFEHLPTSHRLLVFIEDAHERSDDLAMVVTGILRQRPRARVVITTRPYGRLIVQQALRAAQVDEPSVPRWDLANLKRDDAQALAAEVLGSGREHAARVLAQVAADSPLLLVSAAAAVRRGDLDIAAVQGDTNIHQLLLDVFVQSALSRSAQRDDDRALLHAVAALQPVATNVPHFQVALSSLLDLPFTRISPRLRALEAAGIVVHRGALVRITPDLLGDALLAEAAVNPHDGSSTDYLRRVQECAEGDALANAVLNAGRVDWQRNGRGLGKSRALDPLWSVIETGFKEGGAYTRTTALPLLQKVAPFQPYRVLNLVLWALDNPTDEDDRPTEINWLPGTFSQSDVVQQVPRILEAVALDLDQVRTVYDLLWSMGREDRRLLKQTPESPLRVILDLAAYVPGKPLAYQEVLLDALEDWLRAPLPEPANRMPLALLDPVYAYTAESQSMDGWTLTFRTHDVNADVVAPVRRRATAILLEQYLSPDESRAVAAAESVREALRFATEPFDEQNVAFLNELARLATTAQPGPMVSLATQRSLSWTAKHGRDPLRGAARSVMSALPYGVEHRLATLLHTDTYDDALVPEAADGERLDITLRHWEAERSAVVTELRDLPLGQVANLLVSVVEVGSRVLDHHSAGVYSLLKPTLTELPDLALALLNRLAHAQDATIGVMLPTVLAAAFAQDMPRTMETCRRLAAAGTVTQALAVARALQELAREPVPHETDVLGLAHILANHPVPAVRAAALEVAVSMLRTSKNAALELLTSVPFGEMGATPHRLWWAFTKDGLLTWQELTEHQRVFFVDQLETLPSLHDYTVQEFIAYLVSVDAWAVTDLLCARVEHWEGESAQQGFDPLPFEWDVRLPFSADAERPALLRSIRDWLAAPREDAWRRELHAPELFWTVAGPADESVLRLLLEPYEQADANLAHAVTPLLSRLPMQVVWGRVDFVTILLQTANRLSNDLFRRTAGHLQSTFLRGVRSRGLGEPYSEDVEVAERARRIRAGLPRGSVVDLFYKALEETAQISIEREIAQDVNDL